jgi:hypothetical protein
MRGSAREQTTSGVVLSRWDDHDASQKAEFVKELEVREKREKPEASPLEYLPIFQKQGQTFR